MKYLILVVAFVFSNHSFAIDVTTLVDRLDPNAQCLASGGDCSLREAIAVANSNPGPDEIKLTVPGTYHLTLQNTLPGNGRLLVTDSLLISGNFSSIIDGQSLGTNCFYVTQGVALAVDKLTVQNCTGYRGAAIFTEPGASLVLLHSTFRFNSAIGAGSSGGAIEMNTGSLLISIGSNFEYNLADYGGAIEVFQFALALFDQTTFLGNYANVDGGALYLINNWIDITNSNFRSNSARISGGGIAAFGVPQVALLWVKNSGFNGNSTRTLGEYYGGGGGIFLSGGLAILQNNGFTHNLSGTAGGAVSVAMYQHNPSAFNSGLLSLSNTYSMNKANTAGAVSVYQSIFASSSDKFERNHAEFSTGGVKLLGSQARIEHGSFLQNSADWHAGAAEVVGTNSLSDVVISKSEFLGNTSKSDGGAVYFLNTGTLKQSTLSHNSASRGGAVFQYQDAGASHIENSTIVNNHASYEGGAIYSAQRSALIALNSCKHCTIWNNTASTSISSILNKRLPDYESKPQYQLSNSVIEGTCHDVHSTYSIDPGHGCVNDTEINNLMNTDPQLIAFAPLSGLTPVGEVTVWIPNQGSPALNSIPQNSCLPTDQRGRPRGGNNPINSGTCDRGALERAGLRPPQVSEREIASSNELAETKKWFLKTTLGTR